MNGNRSSLWGLLGPGSQHQLLPVVFLNEQKNFSGGMGDIAQWIAFALPDPAAWVQCLAFPTLYSLIVNVAEVHQRHCCIEQWTEEA